MVWSVNMRFALGFRRSSTKHHFVTSEIIHMINRYDLKMYSNRQIYVVEIFVSLFNIFSVSNDDILNFLIFNFRAAIQ